MGRLVEMAGVGLGALLIYFVLPLDRRGGELLAAAAVLAAAGALIPLTVRRAREVLVSPQPLLVAIQSLSTMLTLLVVSFASAYYVLGTRHPGQIDGISTKIDALYFTVTILSTVGFGDVTAVGQTARAIVTVHMVVNFILVAVAVRLVSWALKQRQDLVRSAPEPPPAGRGG